MSKLEKCLFWKVMYPTLLQTNKSNVDLKMWVYTKIIGFKGLQVWPLFKIMDIQYDCMDIENGCAGYYKCHVL